ncbi:MAG: hypothetical protein C0615_11765 [Desulfuromonas sp.]|nr:MAG: hypothetical protein C0615_11765 [Desulfuromonas sp.]
MKKETRPSRLLLIELIAIGIGALFSVRKTLRYQNKLEVEHPCIIVGFHDEILPTIDYLKESDSVQMVANSQIGFGLAKVLRSWGYQNIVHGSPGKSSKRAFLALLRQIKQGKTAFIAPDGSRGPRHVIKDGAIFLAKQGKVPIYLISPNYKGIRFRFLWDKFLLPFPFAKVTFRYQRLEVPPEASREEMEELRLEAEKKMQEMCNPC